MALRPLRPEDGAEALAVLIDAVQSQAVALYGGDQVQAWCEHARTAADLPAALARGKGWASVDADPGPASDVDGRRLGTRGGIEAFALRDPADRLSLLYCRGRSCRQGRATALIAAVEQEAAREGQRRLRTEASQLSRPLLERLGWQVEAAEVVVLAGVSFERWRMVKLLKPSPALGLVLPPENGRFSPGGDG